MEITQFICGDLAEYDPSADLWTVRPSALRERYRGGVCALGDRLYAIGGVDDGYLIPGVEVYRTDTNLWARQGWIANPRAFFSSVALDDAVYPPGGSFSTNRYSAEPLEHPEDYRDRCEQLTGISLRQCPVCQQGRMVEVEQLPAVPAFMDTS